MEQFSSVVKKTRTNLLYLDIPKEIMKKMNLKPFMTARIKTNKNKIILSNFGKTVKIKVDLKKKEINLLKKLMMIGGYGSLDETISNIIMRVFTKEKGHSVYIYPENYLKSKYILIDDYEKSLKVTTNY